MVLWSGDAESGSETLHSKKKQKRKKAAGGVRFKSGLSQTIGVRLWHNFIFRKIWLLS